MAAVTCKVDGHPIPEHRLMQGSSTCSKRCADLARQRRHRGLPEADPMPPAEEQRQTKEACTCNPHPIVATDGDGLRCFKCCGPLTTEALVSKHARLLGIRCTELQARQLINRFGDVRGARIALDGMARAARSVPA